MQPRARTGTHAHACTNHTITNTVAKICAACRPKPKPTTCQSAANYYHMLTDAQSTVHAKFYPLVAPKLGVSHSFSLVSCIKRCIGQCKICVVDLKIDEAPQKILPASSLLLSGLVRVGSGGVVGFDPWPCISLHRPESPVDGLHQFYAMTRFVQHFSSVDFQKEELAGNLPGSVSQAWRGKRDPGRSRILQG